MVSVAKILNILLTLQKILRNKSKIFYHTWIVIVQASFLELFGLVFRIWNQRIIHGIKISIKVQLMHARHLGIVVGFKLNFMDGFLHLDPLLIPMDQIYHYGIKALTQSMITLIIFQLLMIFVLLVVGWLLIENHLILVWVIVVLLVLNTEICSWKMPLTTIWCTNIMKKYF